MEYSEKLAVTVAILCETISNENNICFQIKNLQVAFMPISERRITDKARQI